MVAETTGSAASGNQGESRVTAGQQRRARVLKHDDLRLRLTQEPINYARPEDWNGYIPPASDFDDGCPNCRRDPGRGGCSTPHLHTRRVNDSPRRAALVALAQEALRRELKEQAGHE